ncbi:MAG: VanZ family protein [Saccharospirillum sp.]
MTELERTPRPKPWKIIALALVATPLLVIDRPAGADQELARGLWNLGYVAFFALAVLALRRQLDMRNWPHWLAISIAVFVISVVVEFLQYGAGRERGWEDIERNLIGAWFAMFWLIPGNAQVWTGRIIATGLVLAQLSVVGQLALTDFRVSQRLPILSSLENPYELSWWDGPIERSTEQTRLGQFSLKVLYDDSGYSSATLHTLPSDWRGYTNLRIEVYNPQLVPVSLNLRIQDQAHQQRGLGFSDRYTLPFIAEHGWNTVEVALDEVLNAPETRQMQMARIAQLEVFTTNLSEPAVIYLDHLRLR